MLLQSTFLVYLCTSALLTTLIIIPFHTFAYVTCVSVEDNFHMTCSYGQVVFPLVILCLWPVTSQYISHPTVISPVNIHKTTFLPKLNMLGSSTCSMSYSGVLCKPCTEHYQYDRPSLRVAIQTVPAQPTQSHTQPGKVKDFFS